VGRVFGNALARTLDKFSSSAQRAVRVDWVFSPERLRRRWEGRAPAQRAPEEKEAAMSIAGGRGEEAWGRAG